MWKHAIARFRSPARPGPARRAAAWLLRAALAFGLLWAPLASLICGNLNFVIDGSTSSGALRSYLFWMLSALPVLLTLLASAVWGVAELIGLVRPSRP